MKIKYNLHDSLIEKLSYDSLNKTAFLEIDLCNWMQNDYEKNQPENKIICIIFNEVSYIDPKYLNFDFDSNEILNVTNINDNTINIVFISDPDVCELTITAKSITYKEI
ncbi:hypothetical protein BCR32DRAFT_287691 [Anaeromyces robustus]|uniref:Uncharacterized protein n=1 Tax=Anaeromyces robustus TaxID=1754192 RepID=A0A1Y1VQD7_9FUNG|nr:hypothetical protein BCR32DRAFT_287691 [Anaeromyces robustus]|eukprot:ORX63528.1 hypothetical protein BCR32DRAFT_287691 [Anaeromyces robustus]